jgi:hypothetical protein
MFGELRKFGSSEGVKILVNKIVPGTMDPDTFHGVLLSVDPYWLGWWLKTADAFAPNNSYLARNVDARWLLRHGYDFPIDFNLRPPSWSDHCKSIGWAPDSHPIFFRFLMGQKDFSSARASEMLVWEKHPIIYEYRPMAKAISARSIGANNRLRPGSCIGNSRKNTRGTLGGFLGNEYRTINYLVSCAHVLGDVGSDVSFYPTRNPKIVTPVGGVIFSRVAPVMQSSGISVSAPSNATGPLDLAVAGLKGDVQFESAVHGPGAIHTCLDVDRFCVGDEVCFFGQKSGLVRAQIGAYALSLNIDIAGKLHCFSDLFQLLPRKPFYLNSDLARPGDSGAWVLGESDAATSWYGMIIADDGFQAYACSASNILDACTQSSNLGNLSLLCTHESVQY